jgi:hypothetical protein
MIRILIKKDRGKNKICSSESITWIPTTYLGTIYVPIWNGIIPIITTIPRIGLSYTLTNSGQPITQYSRNKQYLRLQGVIYECLHGQIFVTNDESKR